MQRIGYDSVQFQKEKAKLPEPDGMHCIICGGALTQPDKRRKYCSIECYSAWYESLHIRDWSVVRAAAMKRDGMCMSCAQHDTEQLEVHHIIPISEGGDEFDVDNCVTLCKRCHIIKHSVIGNKSRKNRSLGEYK